MKLLQLIRTMDPCAGGTAQAIRNLAPHTFEHGCAMEVVCLDDPTADYISGEGFPIPEEDGAGLVAADTPAGAKQLFQSWAALSPAGRVEKRRAAQLCYEKRFGSSLAAKNLFATIEESSPRSHLRTVEK